MEDKFSQLLYISNARPIFASFLVNIFPLLCPYEIIDQSLWKKIKNKTHTEYLSFRIFTFAKLYRIFLSFLAQAVSVFYFYLTQISQKLKVAVFINTQSLRNITPK